MRLQRHRRRKALRLGDFGRLGDLPAEIVGKAVVGNLAGPDGVVEEPQRLLDRGQRVPGVHLVEIDPLDPEALQRRLERRRQVLARQPDVVGPRAHREPRLGGNHHLRRFRRPGFEPPPDNGLRRAGRIDVGGVEEIASGRRIGVHDGKRRRFVRLGPERHRSEAPGGDDRAGVAEPAVFHGVHPKLPLPAGPAGGAPRAGPQARLSKTIAAVASPLASN